MGAVAALVFLTLLVFAFIFRKRPDFAIVFIIASGLFLRVYVSSDPYLHEWDERYHALVAKNLTQHMLKPTLYENPVLPVNDSTWVDGHIWLHKQPLPLWSIAISYKIFGASEFTTRIPSILYSTLSILLLYLIGKMLFSAKTGLLAAFFLCTNGLIIELTGGRSATDHIDICFLFWVLAGVFFAAKFYLRPKYLYCVLTGICIGAAVLSKWLPAYIVLAVFAVLSYNRFGSKKTALGSIIVLLVSLAVFIPWQLFILKIYPEKAAVSYAYNVRHLTEVLDGNGGPFYYFLDKIRIVINEFIYLPLLWILYLLFTRRINHLQLALLVWILVPLVFFSIAQTKMQAYILFTFPAYFLITALFLDWLWTRFNATRRWVPMMATLAFIILALRFGAERATFIQPPDKEKTETANRIKQYAKLLPDNAIVFNEPRNIEAMFILGKTAYAKLPGDEEIRLLRQKGYLPVFTNSHTIPKDRLGLQGVLYLNN